MFTFLLFKYPLITREVFFTQLNNSKSSLNIFISPIIHYVIYIFALFSGSKTSFLSPFFASKFLSNHNILWSNPTFSCPNHNTSSELSLLRAASMGIGRRVVSFSVYILRFLKALCLLRVTEGCKKHTLPF